MLKACRDDDRAHIQGFSHAARFDLHREVAGAPRHTLHFGLILHFHVWIVRDCSSHFGHGFRRVAPVMRQLGIVLAIGCATESFALFDENGFAAQFSHTARRFKPRWSAAYDEYFSRCHCCSSELSMSLRAAFWRSNL